MNFSKKSMIIGVLGLACAALVQVTVAQDDLDELMREGEAMLSGLEEELGLTEPEPAADIAAVPESEQEADEEPVAVDEPEAPEADEEPVAVEEPEESETADEPVAVDEPEEPVADEEPVAAEEGETAEEPVAVDEPEAPEADEEPVTLDEPEEPVAVDEPEEPAADEDPVAVDEPEEPVVADEPVAVDEPEEPVADDEPVAVDEPEEPVVAEEPVALDEPEEPEVSEEPASEEPATVEEPEEPAAAEEPTAEEEPVTVVEPVVAPAAATPPAPAQVSNDDEMLLNDVMAVEKLRFSSINGQGRFELEQAREAMRSHKWDEVIEYYRLADTHLRSAKFKTEIRQGLGEANYQLAKLWLDRGDLDRADEYVAAAVDLKHPRAARLRDDIESKRASREQVQESAAVGGHRRNQKEYKALRDKIRSRLEKSAYYFGVADLDNALEQCELVLKDDPYNRQALEMRYRIERRRAIITDREREVARKGMIADVGRAWRPVYAVDAAELKEVGTTSKIPGLVDSTRSLEQDIERRMKEMILPSISFRPPATIIDAVDYFRQASRDFDRPDLPMEQRGFNFVLDMGKQLTGAGAQLTAEDDESGFGAAAADEATAEQGPGGVPQIPNIAASNISLWEALKLVCQISGFKFKVQGSVVMVMPKEMATEELITRSYNVLESFLERVNGAAGDVQDAQAGFGGGGEGEGGGDNQEESWKQFFGTMGVVWPKDSRIIYIKTIGKLRVKNTAEQLAVLEQALEDLNVTPRLIEIETRFVEVAQEDLNSLGFEWLLNSDYTLSTGRGIGKLLGLKSGRGKTTTTTTSASGSGDNPIGSTTTDSSVAGSSVSTRPNMRNSISAFGGDSDYGIRNRYLSTSGNPIAGEGSSINDQFMRVNAYLGTADISMILHMLSQRSDTDLLSAPKVVTRSGMEAEIKVVTEYIYPTDYDVQLQSSSSSSSGSNGGSQSAILAVVEPQNFTMREVGVILQVTPEVSAEGAMINLALHPRVIDEPTWKNYGMKIPYSGNSSALQDFTGLGEIFTSLAEMLSSLSVQLDADTKSELAQRAINSATSAVGSVGQPQNITYYDVPMEQPFFSERSITTNISIYNGATVVMGGLITEQRKSMEDKVPFLGDIPFIGRFFRSRSEWSSKRNLLIFVTARLVDPAGREVHMGRADDTSKDSGATPVLAD